jgi:hypothetical protein
VKGQRPGADSARDRPDDGALARWFRDLLPVSTCDVLTNKVLVGLFPMDKHEVKAVFDRLYTLGQSAAR